MPTCATSHTQATPLCTDRPSRARVAESCWSFNGITSSTCRKHLRAWQPAMHAWRASAIGGLTSPGRAVRCAATCGDSARVRTRIYRVLGCIPVSLGAVGRKCGLRHHERRDYGSWQHALCTPPVLVPTRVSARFCEITVLQQRSDVCSELVWGVRVVG